VPRGIDDAVLSSLSLDAVLDQLLDGAAERMHAASLCLSLPEGRVFRRESAAEVVAAGAPPAGRARRHEAKGVLQAEGNGAHPGAPAWAGPEAGALEVPVAIGGERLGTLRVVPHPGLDLGEWQRALARDLAAHAAVALERARLFDRIVRAKQELETLFHALREGIAIAGGDGRILRANRAFAELLALAPQAIVGRPAAELLPGGVVPALSHDQVIDPEERATHEVEDEERGRVFEVTTTPLFDPQLLLIGQVHTLRDVTEERRMKEQLIQSEKLAAMGQLVAGVSHELSSPIGIMLGHAELLVGTPGLDEASRRSAEAILGQASRAARTVRQLLSVGRPHAPVKEHVSVNGLVREVVGLVETDFRVNRRRPVRLALHLDAALPPIMADPHQLEQVFLNIVNNARQAIVSADVGSRIDISTAANGRTVRVRIADDGPGIPARVLRRIFDPFFTTKPEGEGTGLGLSICYGIVEEHGGKIWAASAEGRGAAFTIDLPIDGQPGAC
jgi:two-component system NtrC family sensor kinase